MASRRRQGNFVFQQIELKAEITNRWQNDLSMASVLNRAKSTCTTLLTDAALVERIKDTVTSMFTKIQQLELSLFTGFTSKEELEQPQGLIKQCMDLVRFDIIPLTSALSSTMDPTPSNDKALPAVADRPTSASFVLARLLRCDFQLAHSFFCMTHIQEIGLNVLTSQQFGGKAIMNDFPSIQANHSQNPQIEPKAQRTKNAKRKGNKAPPAKSERNVAKELDTGNHPLSTQLMPLSLQQRIDNVLHCEKQLDEALAALNSHIESERANGPFDTVKMTSLMKRLHNEIDMFIATTTIQHPPKPNSAATQAAQHRPSEAVNVSPDANDDAADESTEQNQSEYEESDFDDDFDILELLQKPSQPLTYIEPSDKLLETMDRLCEESGVEDAVWLHSPKVKNLIIVHGRGVDRDNKKNLETEMSKRFSSHKYLFAELDSTSTNLSCVVLKSTCDKDVALAPWSISGQATCEAVFAGKQPHKGGRKCHFAATSAHLLLDIDQQKKLNSTKSQEYLDALDSARREVYKQMDECVFQATLQTNKNQVLDVHLCNPPLIGYKTNCVIEGQQDPIKQVLKQSEFMTDIALIPIESNCEKEISVWPDASEMTLSGLCSLNAEKVQSIANGDVSVFANKGRKGRTVRMKETVSKKPNGESSIKGLHIPFILDDDCEPFKEGDSGSLIYLKLTGGNKNGEQSQYNMAVGILRGQRCFPEEYVYEAVVLGACIDAIMRDFSHLVVQLELLSKGPAFPYPKRVKSTGPVPPKSMIK